MVYRNGIKRGLDVIISLIALPFIFLFILIPAGIAIKAEDGGSIFYVSQRYGIYMKRFNMYKLRTMKMNAPDIRNEDGTTYNSTKDPRLTKIGRFLRKTSIDELPQLINVLIGDMSLVGPRPSPMGNERTYVEFVRKKFEVRPGITGYNQALNRNGANLDIRYKNDVYYVENVSFWLDVKILIMTFVTVLKKKNIYNS